MTEAKKSTKTYWLFTLISLVALVIFLMFWPAWCWVVFPFLLTSMVLAFDRM